MAKEKDASCEEVENKPKGTIKIEVYGGLVSDVKGLPEGYDYEVNDLDIKN